MTERRCYVCKETKPIDSFHVTAWMCKPCQKAYDANRKNRGSGSNATDAAKERKRRWQEANKENKRHENAARRAVRSAVLSGLIIRQYECEACGKHAVRRDGVTAVQAHHDDYSKPLVVRWLCAKCHSAWHRQRDAAMGKGGRADG